MALGNRADNVPVQPTNCPCALFVRALALDPAFGGYIRLPQFVLPLKGFVGCNGSGFHALAQQDGHSLLGVVTSENNLRP